MLARLWRVGRSMFISFFLDLTGRYSGQWRRSYETTIVNVCKTDKIAVENRSHNLKLRCKSIKFLF